MHALYLYRPNAYTRNPFPFWVSGHFSRSHFPSLVEFNSINGHFSLSSKQSESLSVFPLKSPSTTFPFSLVDECKLVTLLGKDRKGMRNRNDLIIAQFNLKYSCFLSMYIVLKVRCFPFPSRFEVPCWRYWTFLYEVENYEFTNALSGLTHGWTHI